MAGHRPKANGRDLRAGTKPQDLAGLGLLCFVIVLGSNLFFPQILNHEFLGASPTGENQASSFSVTSAIMTTATATASRFWYVGAESILSNTQPNNGIRSTIQVKSQTQSSGALSFWVSEAFSNNLWAQVGYFVLNGSAPAAFFQVWNLTSGAELSTGALNASEGFHVFSMNSVPGGNVWQFKIDSNEIGSFVMGTNESNPSYPAYAMSEEGYAIAPFGFTQVLFSSALEFYDFGTWHNATTGESYGNTWGLQGQEQSPILSANQILVGGSASGSNGTAFVLWG
jgi:hypothetical protein